MWLVYGWPPCSREINQRTTFCNTFLNVLVAYGIGFVWLSCGGLVGQGWCRGPCFASLGQRHKPLRAWAFLALRISSLRGCPLGFVACGLNDA